MQILSAADFVHLVTIYFFFTKPFDIKSVQQVVLRVKEQVVRVEKSTRKPSDYS
jgi:hypothetical protein